MKPLPYSRRGLATANMHNIIIAKHMDQLLNVSPVSSANNLPGHI